MGFAKKQCSSHQNDRCTGRTVNVSVIRSNDAVVVIDNGNVRMRFVGVSESELSALRHPLYKKLVP